MNVQVAAIPIHGRSSIEVIPGNYFVTLEDKPFLLLRFPFTLDCAGSRFTHPKLLAKGASKQEYKHYRSGGSKFWSARPGVDLYLAVDKRHIRLVAEEAGSYPRLRIGNTEITTSVGGGGSPWTDNIRSTVTVLTNVKLAVLQEVARMAMTAEQAAKAGVVAQTPSCNDTPFLANALARMDAAKRLAPGHKVILRDGFSFRDSQELAFVHWVNGQRMICSKDGMHVSVSLCRIDWVKTAALNSISVREPSDLAHSWMERMAA